MVFLSTLISKFKYSIDASDGLIGKFDISSVHMTKSSATTLYVESSLSMTINLQQQGIEFLVRPHAF